MAGNDGLLTGTKRFDSEKAGDREVQRTMLELLNQLDGFMPTSDIKVVGLLSLSGGAPRYRPTRLPRHRL